MPMIPTLTTQTSKDGTPYRDLNKNGKLDPYEDKRVPIDERIEDLLDQMTLPEKAGLMFHTMIGMNQDGTLVEEPTPFSPVSTTGMVAGKLINHLNVLEIAPPREMAQWVNRLQYVAENTRLGIPVTISTDPRHSFSKNMGAMHFTPHFSQWPEPIGLAATGDDELVETFGDIARQEYIAVGIRMALHPMADLATEPRWSRISGTFGEDADMAAQMTFSYIRGFQGTNLYTGSVACMTKHFPGGGPQLNGEDPHFSIGKEQVYPGDYFDYHLMPFDAAFEAGTAQIMPYYGMPVGLEIEGESIEEVGFSFNKQIITDLLRGQYRFDGVVCTDWKLITHAMMGDDIMVEAKCWGVEDLSAVERVKKAIKAGVDQFGGESCPEIVVNLVERGEISEERINDSMRRILNDKFRLGLFDNPYVDPEQAADIAGSATFRAAGEEAQRKSIVLLKNGEINGAPTLPLQGQPKLYLENIDPGIASKYGQVVESVAEADLAILRLSTPYEPREGFLEQYFHSGNLDFEAGEKARILSILEQVPTVVDIYLERPAVIPEIAEKSAALLGNFSVNDAAMLDVIFGRFNPCGKLPFELPSSMEAVRQQKEDLPYDSVDPLFGFGHGLGYE